VLLAEAFSRLRKGKGWNEEDDEGKEG